MMMASNQSPSSGQNLWTRRQMSSLTTMGAAAGPLGVFALGAAFGLDAGGGLWGLGAGEAAGVDARLLGGLVDLPLFPVLPATIRVTGTTVQLRRPQKSTLGIWLRPVLGRESADRGGECRGARSHLMVLMRSSSESFSPMRV